VTVPLNSYVTHARGQLSVGRVITFVSASFNLGVIVGPLIGGWIGNQFGLQKTFFIAAIIFILSTVTIFFIHPQPIEKNDPVQTKPTMNSIWNPILLKFLIIAFIVTFALYLPQPFSQNYLQNEQGLNLAQIGQLISTRSIGLVILNLALGQLNARLGYLLSQVGMALFCIFMWQGTGMPWFTAAYFMLGSYLISRSLAVAQVRSLIQAARMGIGYGLLETASASAVILAAPLAGILYQYSPISIYPVSLVLISIAFIVTIFLSPIRSGDL
jgi:MFS transporter, DHA1 family, multidrug resistance protein